MADKFHLITNVKVSFRESSYEYIVEKGTIFNTFGVSIGNPKCFFVRKCTDTNGNWVDPFVDNAVILIDESKIQSLRMVTQDEPVSLKTNLPEGYWYA